MPVDRDAVGAEGQCSNYRRGCRGYPRHSWSSVSPALLLVEASQPGMLFVPGSVIVRLWQGVSKDESEVVLRNKTSSHTALL